MFVFLIEMLLKLFIEGGWLFGLIEVLVLMLECFEEMCRVRFSCVVSMFIVVAVTFVV